MGLIRIPCEAVQWSGKVDFKKFHEQHGKVDKRLEMIAVFVEKKVEFKKFYEQCGRVRNRLEMFAEVAENLGGARPSYKVTNHWPHEPFRPAGVHTGRGALLAARGNNKIYICLNNYCNTFDKSSNVVKFV